MAEAHISTPGLYFFAGKRKSATVERYGGLRSYGPFMAGGAGALYQHAENDDAAAFVYGLLIPYPEGKTDHAQAVLDLYEKRGIDALKDLEGLFNLVLIDKKRRKAFVMADAAGSLPLYLYREDRTFAASVTPLFFRQIGLPMSFHRRALYESFRLLYPASPQTFIRPVLRARPATIYIIGEDGISETTPALDWTYTGDSGWDLDAMALRIWEITSDVIDGVLDHPSLRDRSLHLSLTGGMDSRHILGKLIDKGRRPELIRHVRIDQGEYRSCWSVCQALDLPLLAVPLEEVDHRTLMKRWLECSAGLVNVHQCYLLHMMERTPPNGVIGFDGFLMDRVLGIYPKNDIGAHSNPVSPIWGLLYTRPGKMRKLFRDWQALEKEALDRLSDEVDRYEGPSWFRYMLLDIHSRGLHYTGPPCTMMADEALYFSPGAHRQAFLFLLHADRAIGGEKRARLEAMNTFFPKLAKIPDSSGIPFTKYESFRKSPKKKRSYARQQLISLLSGWRIDPAPGTEHEWLRRIPHLHTVNERAVYESKCIADGHIDGKAMRRSWKLLNLGAYEAWTLMSFFSAEMAYRTLVLGEDPADTIDWLFS